MEKTSEPHWRSFALALGTRVRRLRVMRGLTQQELAEASGLSRNTISMWERNETNRKRATDPTLSNVYAVARALDVPPAVLIPDATHTPGPRSTDAGVLDIDMRWPTAEGDTLTFRERELLGVHQARETRESRKDRGKVTGKGQGARGGRGVPRPGRFPRPGGRGVPGMDRQGSDKPGRDRPGKGEPGGDGPGADD
ncbi:helix-turn-helix domain-containing protein [Corynebacterium frankenforstense]